MHFAFRCACSTLRVLYFSALTVAAGFCVELTLRPCFQQAKLRTARAFIYCFLGVFLFAALIPAWQSLESLEALDTATGLWSCVGLAIMDFLGGAMYTTRVPERWFPGKLDLLGQSHNWMHLLVMLGALIRLEGLLKVYERWTVNESMTTYCRSTL
jgi:adiponectin receptor